MEVLTRALTTKEGFTRRQSRSWFQVRCRVSSREAHASVRRQLRTTSQTGGLFFIVFDGSFWQTPASTVSHESVHGDWLAVLHAYPQHVMSPKNCRALSRQPLAPAREDKESLPKLLASILTEHRANSECQTSRCSSSLTGIIRRMMPHMAAALYMYTNMYTYIFVYMDIRM